MCGASRADSTQTDGWMDDLAWTPREDRPNTNNDKVPDTPPSSAGYPQRQRATTTMMMVKRKEKDVGQVSSEEWSDDDRGV